MNLHIVYGPRILFLERRLFYFLENDEEIIPQYYMHRNILSTLKSTDTQ